jgi:hypothetical protein
MKKIVLLSLIYCTRISGLYADISPNPIQAKGIMISDSTAIKMTYEKVIVDLTLDSSFVHCYFRLHNEGKATKIQIGYPNMSTYTKDNLQNRLNSLDVWENNKRIDVVDFFAPDSIKLNTDNNSDKPWYLWNSYFKENEIKIINISYRLPCGIAKKRLFCTFNYLLSTGANWKDKIDTAEIIVNLKNFDKDFILKISPKNYTKLNNQIKWNFYEIEPTRKNDIFIFYETMKGQYEKQLKNIPSPGFLYDNVTVLTNDMRDSNSIDYVNPNEIASLEVIKSSDTLKKQFPNINTSNGLILIYSKRFAINKLSNMIYLRIPGSVDEIKYYSTSDFEDNYTMVLNDKSIKKSDITGEIMKIDENSIIDISIKKSDNNKKEIIIKTNK